MRKFLYALCCVFFMQSLFAAPQLSERQKQIYQNIAPSEDDGDLSKNIDDPFIATSSLVLSLDEYKKSYFVGELITLKLYAKTTETTEFDFKLDFIKSQSLEFLNPNAKWQKEGNDYFTTLYFQAKDLNARLEQIDVSLTRNGTIFQQSSFVLEPISFKKVNAGRSYSGIVADELVVKSSRTRHFDTTNLVIVMELYAKNANLKNFFIDDSAFLTQRIDNVNGDFNGSSASYSAVFAPSKNTLSFSYFNLKNNQLEDINLQIIINDDEPVSTQSDLNPSSNSLNFYKQIGLWILAGLFALGFVFRRNFVFFALALICFALSFLFDSSSIQKGVVKANASAKLLPTSNSTYFHTSSADEEVEILGKRQDYIKVLFKDGKIGWVKSDDLRKN